MIAASDVQFVTLRGNIARFFVGRQKHTAVGAFIGLEFDVQFVVAKGCGGSQ